MGSIVQQCHTSVRAGGDLRTLRTLVAGVPLSELQALPTRSDPARPYGRNVLLDSSGLEMMVAKWTPGTPCAPHDHGGAVGVVRVIRGRALHRIWAIRGAELEIVAEEQVEAGGLLLCGADLIHSMGDDGGDEPLVTLHAYLGGVPYMTVYDVNERSSLQVDGSRGAWIPEPCGVLARSAGYVTRDAWLAVAI